MERLAAVLTASLLCLAAVPSDLPTTDRFCVSLVDFDGETTIGRIDIEENASRIGYKALRGKIGRHVPNLARSPLVDRPERWRLEVSELSQMVVLPGDDALADGQGGVVCTCSKLECADPTVCGVSCKGPCEDCLRCVLVRAGSPIRWRPKK